MLSPRPSHVRKTLLVVFFAAVCLFIFSPAQLKQSARGDKVPQKASASESTVPTGGAKLPIGAVRSEAAPDLERFTFARRWGHEKEPALAAFSRWVSDYTNAAPAAKSLMSARGIELAQQRRAAFVDIIRANPKLALAKAVPAVVRNQLPQAITDLLEERVTGKGAFVALGRAEPHDGQTVSRRAIVNGREYVAYVYGDRASQQTRANVSLHGVAINGELALSDSPLRVFEPGEPVPANKSLAADSCPISRRATAPTKDGPRPNAVAAESGDHVYWMCHGKHVAAAANELSAGEGQFPFQTYAASGARSALVMMVDFSDLPGASSGTTTVDSTIAAVDKFLTEGSYGDFNLASHTITPVLRMPRTSRTYSDLGNTSGDSMLLNDARSAARTAGFNPDTFDFDIVTFAEIGFGWSGQGYIGSKGAWIQGAFNGGTVAHELGHNLGVWHANSWNSSESAISPNGSHEEYGNIFDVMGRSSGGFPNNHYSANFKRLIGWLAPENVASITASGRFRLYAHDQSSRVSGRLYGLSIPTGIVAGEEVEDYWIDFRQLFASAYPASVDGAIIQWGNDSGTKSASRLLDMNYQTATKNDAPLSIGKTFNDPDFGLQIKPVAKGGSGADAYLDVEISLVAPPSVDLGDAVDSPNFTWTSSAAAWTGKRNVTHDGVDAAVTGPIRDNGETYIETTVDGPGALFFWWKVSSEAEFDFLKLIIDDEERAAISGQVDWEKRGYELPAGPHTVRWIYKKDGGSVGGADRGWLDEVSFITGDHAPFINAQPASLIAGRGETAQIHIDAIGSDPLTYHWYKLSDTGEPVEVAGAISATLTISNVQDSDAGVYNCVVDNPIGSVTSSDAILTVVRVVTLADAVDNTTADWATSGAVGWAGEQEFTHDGSDAAQSGAIANGKETTLTATINGPGTLTFWWKVSSEQDYDLLSLYMDGDVIDYISGEVDWTQKTLTIPNGVHRLRWTFSKDANLFEGQDTAWVDQVIFTPIANAAPEFLTHPAAQSVSLGGAAIFTADYTATPPLTFTWLKDGVPIQPRAGINGIGADTLCITNVQNSDAGLYSLQIANAFGTNASNGATLEIVPLSLADALDQPTRAFLTGGTVPWLAQTGITHDMSDAARSGRILDDQLTWIETRVTGPATVAFWWKASSEQDYDFLSFELDTVSTLRISGQADWRRETVALGMGDHMLRWKYRKDRNTPGGEDSAWLDQLEIVPSEPIQPQIANTTVDATGVIATVQSLPPAGNLVVECSSNLVTWNPVSTNAITGTSVTIRRPSNGSSEYLRVKLQ